MAKKSGRPSEFGERKTRFTITITPTLVEFLRSQDEKTPSHKIESTIRNTIAFIEWSRSRENQR